MATGLDTTKHETNGRGVFTSLRYECPHCGKKLKLIEISFFGKPKTVPCYGSCGCPESVMDLAGIQPTKRPYARIGIPDAYIDSKVELNGYDQSVLSGRSLYIYGPNRIGKTTFACALAKSLVDQDVTVRFENARVFMSEVQGMAAGRHSDAMERAYACRVLVLDDLGKEQPTPFAVSMLYQLIEQRKAAGRPIVVTSNFSRGQLGQRWEQADRSAAEAIVARLNEDADTLHMETRPS